MFNNNYDCKNCLANIQKKALCSDVANIACVQSNRESSKIKK